jgi:hypothetical protein
MTELVGFVVALVLGGMVPVVVSAGILLRGVPRLFVAPWKERAVWLATIALLAYCIWKVATHGPITRTPDWEGPTVNPLIWFVLGFVWYELEEWRKKQARTGPKNENR